MKWIETTEACSLLSYFYLNKVLFTYFSDRMVHNICSVIGCDNQKHVFHLKEKWKELNDLGWKNLKKLFICEKHFRLCDLCGNEKKRFPRPNACPVFFSQAR